LKRFRPRVMLGVGCRPRAGAWIETLQGDWELDGVESPPRGGVD